jgi:hypothetical protein
MESKKEKDLIKTAMMIVNQLYDLAEVPVEKRQSINDIATDYVHQTLIEQIQKIDKDAFTRGCACAIASIIHGHGIGTETREAFTSCIGSLQECIDAKVDNFDMNILKQYFK